MCGAVGADCASGVSVSDATSFLSLVFSRRFPRDGCNSSYLKEGNFFSFLVQGESHFETSARKRVKKYAERRVR